MYKFLCVWMYVVRILCQFLFMLIIQKIMKIQEKSNIKNFKI